MTELIKPLSANPTKCSNTLKQFVGKSQRIVWTNCLIVLDHFVKLALKGLNKENFQIISNLRIFSEIEKCYEM